MTATTTSSALSALSALLAVVTAVETAADHFDVGHELTLEVMLQLREFYGDQRSP